MLLSVWESEWERVNEARATYWDFLNAHWQHMSVTFLAGKLQVHGQLGNSWKHCWKVKAGLLLSFPPSKRWRKQYSFWVRLREKKESFMWGFQLSGYGGMELPSIGMNARAFISYRNQEEFIRKSIALFSPLVLFWWFSWPPWAKFWRGKEHKERGEESHWTSGSPCAGFPLMWPISWIPPIIYLLQNTCSLLCLNNKTGRWVQ